MPAKRRRVIFMAGSPRETVVVTWRPVGAVAPLGTEKGTAARYQPIVTAVSGRYQSR
jgi:hypothetical protein